MPVTLSADRAGQFAVLTITDPYTIEEWRLAAEALLQDPVYHKHLGVLVDRRRCTPPSAAFVAEMTQFAVEHKRAMAGAHAAVVVSDDAGFGMGRMAELLNPDVAIHTFRGYDEAERWLFGSAAF